MLVNMKQLEDIFNTKEFKSLSWGQRLWVRIKVAFFSLIDMKNFILLLILVSFTSCGTYYVQTKRPQISHVLAVTSEGDTINMPIEEFRRKVEPNYYNDWRFYYNSQWYWGNNWFYGLNDPYWRWRIYRNYYNRPKVYTPTPPQRPRVQINGRRGSSNQDRQYYTPPNINNRSRSNTTRPETKPRVPTNNTRSKRGNSNKRN
jgi:hypothetical protein